MRRYTSKKYIYTPTLGVKSDFETLLQKFTETGTVRFQSFAEIWKEMNFSKYCAGRQTLREVREFVEECLKIASQFWLPPSSFQVRAGALYLLYGLYNCQLTAPKVKIRVTPENWKSIKEFQRMSREQQHLDIDYVFQKLMLDRAFQFVATPAEYNPFEYRDDLEGKNLPESLRDDESLLSELYSSQVLNQLAAVHDQYYKMKVALAGSEEGDEPDTSLNIINNDLIQNIYRTLKTHKEKQSHASGSQVQQSTSQESASDSEDLKYTSLSVKGALKKKAFKAWVGSKRGRGRGRPKTVRLTDTVVNLQDPKVNACGRLKGRAPKIDIFGKDEEVVIGPGVPPSIGVVDMPCLEQEQIKAEKKSPRKKIKMERKRGSKKKASGKSDEEMDTKPLERDLKAEPSDDDDDEWTTVPPYFDDHSDVTPSELSTADFAKDWSMKVSLKSVNKGNASTSPEMSVQKKSAKRSSKSGKDHAKAASGMSAYQTPRKTARMSVENTDVTEMRKIKSVEKRASLKRSSGGKKLEKEGGADSNDKQDKDNSKEIAVSRRKSKNIRTVKKGFKLDIKDIQSESKKSKRKFVSDDTDVNTGKKPKKSTAGSTLKKKSSGKQIETTVQISALPSAQERLNKKIAQRVRDKRQSQS